MDTGGTSGNNVAGHDSENEAINRVTIRIG